MQLSIFLSLYGQKSVTVETRHSDNQITRAQWEKVKKNVAKPGKAEKMLGNLYISTGR